MISHVGSHTAIRSPEYCGTGFLLHCEFNLSRSVQVSSILAQGIHSEQYSNVDPLRGVYLSTVPSDYCDLYPLVITYTNCYYQKPAKIITFMFRNSYLCTWSSSMQPRLLTWQKKKQR